MAKKFELMEKNAAFALSSKIRDSGQALQKQIQGICITAVMYSNLHGDVSVAQRVFEDMKQVRSIKAQGIIAFCEKFGQLKFDADAKKFVYRKSEEIQTAAKSETYIPTMLEKFSVVENQWYMMTPEKPEVSTLDIDVQFGKWLKRMEREATKPGMKVNNPAVLEDAKKMAAKFKISYS